MGIPWRSCRAFIALLAVPACASTPGPPDPLDHPAPAVSSANPDSLVNAAVSQLRTGDTTGAIALYRAAIAIDPRHGAAGLLISTLYDAGRTREAVELGARYRRQGPRNPRALFRYGWVLGYLWEIDEAESVFRELIAMDSGGIYEAWGHGELAYMARARGNVDDAVRHMELAVRARPEDVISRVGLAHMLLNAGRARRSRSSRGSSSATVWRAGTDRFRPRCSWAGPTCSSAIPRPLGRPSPHWSLGSRSSAIPA